MNALGQRARKKKPAIKLLTRQEASATRQKMISFLLSCTDALDDMITATTKGHRGVIIWSDMEEKDAALLVDSFQGLAMHSQRYAGAYRYALSLMRKWEIGSIVVPRAAKTIVYYFTTGVSLT